VLFVKSIEKNYNTPIKLARLYGFLSIKGIKMDISGIVGFVFMICMTVVLFAAKVSPGIVFITLPVVAGIFSGFSFREIAIYVSAGIRTVIPLAFMFAFAILFFGLLNETGIFAMLVSKILGKAKKNSKSIFFMTVIVSATAHLSGSGAVSYLVILTACKPIYEQNGIPLTKLMCLSSLTFGVMNMLPWAGPCGRLAGALSIDTAAIWKRCIPSQFFGLVLLFFIAYIMANGQNENMQEKRTGEEKKTLLKKENNTTETEKKKIAFCIVCTGTVIILLGVTQIQPFQIFLGGTLILIFVNEKAERRKLLVKYWKQAQTMVFTVLASGVVVGIVTYSPMLKNMTRIILNLIPEDVAEHMHVILGVISNPISLVLSGEVEIFGLVPIAAELVAAKGIASEMVAAAFLIPYSAVIFVLPMTVSVHLGLSICGVSLREHMKQTYFWSLFLSIGMLGFAVIIGMISF
jgi:citrate/H+ symporter, citMHS family